MLSQFTARLARPLVGTLGAVLLATSFIIAATGPAIATPLAPVSVPVA